MLSSNYTKSTHASAHLCSYGTCSVLTILQYMLSMDPFWTHTDISPMSSRHWGVK